VKGWLERRGVSVPAGRVVKTQQEASRAAAAAGYPVVLKVSSDRMLHKTESGAVKLGIASPGQLRREFGDMRARANDSMRHDGFEGVLVERQVPPGVEVIVGLQNDPHFGPVLMVGTGGTYTDLMADVAFRMLPVTRAQIRDMLAGLKGRASSRWFSRRATLRRQSARGLRPGHRQAGRGHRALHGERRLQPGHRSRLRRGGGGRQGRAGGRCASRGHQGGKAAHPAPRVVLRSRERRGHRGVGQPGQDRQRDSRLAGQLRVYRSHLPDQPETTPRSWG